MNENIKATMSGENRQLVEEIEQGVKVASEKMMNASTIEELRNIYIDKSIGNIINSGVDFETSKQMLIDTLNNISEMGASNKISDEYKEKLAKTSNFEELKTIITENFDKEYAGKNLEEIKDAMKAEATNLNKQVAKNVFEQYWDSSKKQFVNCKDEVGVAIKKAARSIQSKSALIYGAIGAGVLGLGTLLCCGGKKSKESTQKELNTQA